MRLIYAEYNPQTNSIDVTTFENYILRMDKMHEFYDKALNSLNINYEEQYIGTTFGKTHVLIIGDTKKRKLITLHGGNGISPLNIRIFIPLLEEYCIIAPDVIGMPGKSEPYRNLDTNKDDNGLWLGDIMDNMNLMKCLFVVSSETSSNGYRQDQTAIFDIQDVGMYSISLVKAYSN